MKAHVLPAAQGRTWVAQGFGVFRRQPMALASMLVAYWLAMMLVAVFPLVGGLIPPLLVPGVSVGFMAAARLASQGQRSNLMLLVEPFKARGAMRPLLFLGALYALSIILVMALSSMADDAVLMNLVLTGRGMEADKVNSGQIMNAAIVAMLAYIPVMAAFWFAPVLVAWHGMAIPKALFFSVAACLQNWRPFGVYGLYWGAIGMGMSLMLGTVSRALSLPLNAAVLLVMPASVILISSLYASYFITYRDIFGDDLSPAPPPSAPRD